MAVTLVPMTDRITAMRERYRSTVPKLCTARLHIITDFYKENITLTGPLKRAYNFKNLCEKLPVTINENEVIVGSQVTSYRASAMYPEFNGLNWFKADYEAGRLLNRPIDNYIVDQEDIDYVLSVADFWEAQNNSARLSRYIPQEYKDKVAGNGVITFRGDRICINPIGHFCANYRKVIEKGFSFILDEARAKIRELSGHMYGKDAERYFFYRSVEAVSEGMITLAKRYSAECAKLAAAETDPARKEELEQMADCLDWIFVHPARNYHDALQALYLYHLGLCLDGQQHGISYGRVDQYLGKYYEKDIADGTITPEYAQELLDMFYLKSAEMNWMKASFASKAIAGYTNGMLMTMGGVDEFGNDATNAVTYMMLQSAARLVLHDPPQALRIHNNTPKPLWDLALECTRIAGGVPTFENDEVLIPGLMSRGLSLEAARDYCLIGCVEPAGCGNHWSMCGASGYEGYFNLANCFLQAINNGINPFPNPDGIPTRQQGLPTGYLYEMTDFNQVLDAVEKQMKYYIDWQISMTNIQEYITAREIPLPLVSATIEGCMESGKDVMNGGAKFNSTGFPGIAIGNMVDSLNITKHLVYDKKICTARELYDALMANWEGFEKLRDYIQNEAPHFGNGEESCDWYMKWVGDRFADWVNAGQGPRGPFSAAMFPVAFNVVYGLVTAATPDGRKLGDPLSDGISPVQAMDKNGPTATIKSVCQLDQSRYPDGTLFNMKFHPSAFSNEESVDKVRRLMQIYFRNGGEEMQLNVTSTQTLKDAQANPEEYKNLVVRVAGFSAYFVELTKGSQDDIITRTELSL